MVKSKFLTWIAVLLFAIFLIYQIYAAAYNPVTTETVSATETVDGIAVTGIVIRDESYIESSSDGVVHFEIEDGERIASGGVIANMYASTGNSIIASELAQVEKDISDIEDIQSYNNVEAADLGLINSKIQGALNDMIRSAGVGNYSETQESRTVLLSFLNRRQIATGSNVDFSARLSELKTRQATLKSQLANPIGKVTAQKSGYFVSTVDGYEQILNGDMIDSITPEFLDSLSPETVVQNSIVGKLVSDYTWYIAVSVSLSDSMKFKTGDETVLQTQLKSNPELSVTVEKINISPNSERAVVIFSCQEMNSELAKLRTGPMTVIRQKYKGLKVSSKALRVIDKTVQNEDGTTKTETVTGVYLLSGMTAKFVPVNIIYSKGDSVLCERSSDDGALKLYDKVIVKGKNIYDGKIIN